MEEGSGLLSGSRIPGGVPAGNFVNRVGRVRGRRERRTGETNDGMGGEGDARRGDMNRGTRVRILRGRWSRSWRNQLRRIPWH